MIDKLADRIRMYLNKCLVLYAQQQTDKDIGYKLITASEIFCFNTIPFFIYRFHLRASKKQTASD